MPVHDLNGTVALETDEYLRPGSSVATLGELPASFAQMGEQSGIDAVALQKRHAVKRISHVHGPCNSSGIVDGASLTLAQLRASLEGRLARFKQPKDLVLLDALPRNAAGKVNKIALRAADRDRVAGQQRSMTP